jgi:hypothetical protein
MLAIGLGIRACQAGHRVAFATAAEWVARLATAHHTGRLQDEITKLGRIPLLIIDEVGYIPFEPEAANLFFQLVSARYEHASLIVTSNKPCGRRGEVFGDDIAAVGVKIRPSLGGQFWAVAETGIGPGRHVRGGAAVPGACADSVACCLPTEDSGWTSTRTT